MSTNNTYPFTIAYPGRVNVIKTDVQVGYPIVNGKVVAGPGNKEDTFYPTIAIWDTGATNTVITKRAAQALNLRPVSSTIVKGVNSESYENVYLVGIVLPNSVRISMVRVTECQNLSHPDDPQQCDVLIGMDIISNGDFAITNSGGQTYLSFQMPSVERIDFTNMVKNGMPPTKSSSLGVPVLQQPQQQAQQQIPKTDRNALCPCGSGKKYKKCHGQGQ